MKKLLAVMLSVLMLVSSFGLVVYAGGDDGYNDVELEWPGGYSDNFNDTELEWGEVLGTGLFAIGDVMDGKVRPGVEFTVPVEVRNNPGIISAVVTVMYDVDVLELVSYEDGNMVTSNLDMSYGPNDDGDFVINWQCANALEDNYYEDGVLVYLTFKVAEDVDVETTEIAISFDPENVFDYDGIDIAFTAEGAELVIDYRMAGDANEDGVISMKDLTTIQKYLNNWDGVSINLDNANVDGDAEVTLSDLVLIQRYMNGWSVELI